MKPRLTPEQRETARFRPRWSKWVRFRLLKGFGLVFMPAKVKLWQIMNPEEAGFGSDKDATGSAHLHRWESIRRDVLRECARYEAARRKWKAWLAAEIRKRI